MRRLNAIIGMESYTRNEWVMAEEDKYGLGQVRKAETFFDTFGFHVKEHKVEQHLCRFIGKPMMNKFLPALRENRMGLDYSKIVYQFTDPDKDKKVYKFIEPDLKEKLEERKKSIAIRKGP